MLNTSNTTSDNTTNDTLSHPSYVAEVSETSPICPTSPISPTCPASPISPTSIRMRLSHDNADKIVDECVICLLELESESVIILSCCKQKLHAKCYAECMQLNNLCPLCRHPQSVNDTRSSHSTRSAHHIILIPSTLTHTNNVHNIKMMYKVICSISVSVLIVIIMKQYS